VGRFAPGGPQITLWVRLPTGLRAPGPVAPWDPQLSFPLGRWWWLWRTWPSSSGYRAQGSPWGLLTPRRVAQRYPSEVCRSGAPSWRAKGGRLDQPPWPHKRLVAQVQRTYLGQSFFIVSRVLTEIWMFADLVHERMLTRWRATCTWRRT
jgi:hypothetical protein